MKVNHKTTNTIPKRLHFSLGKKKDDNFGSSILNRPLEQTNFRIDLSVSSNTVATALRCHLYCWHLRDAQPLRLRQMLSNELCRTDKRICSTSHFIIAVGHENSILRNQMHSNAPMQHVGHLKKAELCPKRGFYSEKTWRIHSYCACITFRFINRPNQVLSVVKFPRSLLFFRGSMVNEPTQLRRIVFCNFKKLSSFCPAPCWHVGVLERHGTSENQRKVNVKQNYQSYAPKVTHRLRSMQATWCHLGTALPTCHFWSRPREGTRCSPLATTPYECFIPISVYVMKDSWMIECTKLDYIDYILPIKLVTGVICPLGTSTLFIKQEYSLNGNLFY